MRTTKPKRNVAGFVDAGGQFHPIRSPQYIGSRKATAKDRRKYSKVLGGDLGIEKQKAALAEKWEDPWDREARLEREERERIEREIDRDVHGSKSERRSLLQFVRDSGGIKRQFRFGGKKAFGKRSEWDKGEIDRLSYKETGKRGLTSERGGKTLDKMYQSAREAGYDVGSIDDMLARVEDEAAGRGTTYATMGALAYNPKKKNPGIADMAALANAVFTTIQIHDHMTKKAPKKKRSTAKRRRNPETQAQINARMAKVRAARKANPKPKATINDQRSTINPRKRVTVPSKGRFYLMTIGQGDDTLGVFINDRDGDGISKKFKTVAAAKAYATKHRLTLENPAKAPRKVNPTFAPAWIKKLLAPVRTASGSDRVKTAKSNPTRKRAAASKVKNPRSKTASVKATPTAAKRNGTKKAVATKKANPRIQTIKAGMKASDIDVRKPFRQPSNIIWCDKCDKFQRDGHSHGALPPKKKPVRKRRTNPPKAPRSRLFENFQGRTASTVRSLETSHHLGSERLIQLGKLHEIKLVGMNPIKINPNRVVLCATPKGKLAIAGQRFAKKNPGMKSNEISFLGEIEHVVYETHKPHHGDRPQQLYIHELGEITGQRPKLYADHLGFPIVKGGAYSVRPEGIVN